MPGIEVLYICLLLICYSHCFSSLLLLIFRASSSLHTKNEHSQLPVVTISSDSFLLLNLIICSLSGVAKLNSLGNYCLAYLIIAPSWPPFLIPSNDDILPPAQGYRGLRKPDMLQIQ
ncbi:hypothetical protein BX600DRAFT_476579 [Xylariales sp. PMI_506]|nr:hypothetical protein BX600DRAFT_476579 [Xylariales sp. PMI_506]